MEDEAAGRGFLTRPSRLILFNPSEMLEETTLPPKLLLHKLVALSFNSFLF
jgi:hypothetical protein